ncbi:transcription factor IIA, alpha/beta subunit [Basidiobolus meristosporus CBS 931.73]|uniref:Transcription factor IIA, alpha/beta subunit n=1 Tax=Basidiobolus meristosporus CBS 931.73 TaxID=1314790 RepID=A0A1Y1YCV3_9FUNG|nr:transcription factor IIA, alpha/beta subunit [Basidiobolus meristosporus CBS 931.73]|eukprot:ORX95556.1 transcription factor IIA, alpha/beta subunit [Basidiobolus meristosporus CBS 931.73]
MSSSIVASVYRHIIDDVITTVQRDFEEVGVDESILQSLQWSWETKIANVGAPNLKASATQGYASAYVDGSSNPDESIEQRSPISNKGQEQYPYEQQYQQYSYDTAALASASNGLGLGNSSLSMETLTPQAELANDSWLGQTPVTSYCESFILPPGSDQRLGANIPQTDGPPYMNPQEVDEVLISQIWPRSPQQIPQVDGGETDDPQDEAAHDYNLEDAINSDLDDTDEDGCGEDGREVDHIVLCQYDKVTRTKNKWKCVLKDGIMFINGKEYLFQKASGDFEW